MTHLEKLSVKTYDAIVEIFDDYVAEIDAAKFCANTQYHDEVVEAMDWISHVFDEFEEHFNKLVVNKAIKFRQSKEE